MTEAIKNTFANGEATISLALTSTVLMLVFVLWQAFHGFRKGVVRQGIKTGLTVIAAIFAFFMSDSFADKLFSFFDEMTIEELIASIESAAPIEESLKGVLLNLNPDIFEYLITMLYGVILAPFVFLILFIVINLVLRLVYHILKLVLRFPNGGKLCNRLIATGVGALHGFIVASIFLLPFITVANITDTALLAVIESSEDEELCAIYENEIAKETKNPVFVVVKALGGDAVLNELATARNTDEVFKAREEFNSIINDVAAELDSLGELDFKNLSEENKTAINNLIEAVGDSDLLSTLVSGVLSGMAKSVEDGYIPLEVDDLFGTFINSAVRIFESSDKTNIEGDLLVIRDVLYILSDCGAIAAMEEGSDLSAILTSEYGGDTVINALLARINSHDRFAPLLTAITEITIEMLIRNMPDLPDNIPLTAETYQNIKAGFNDILSIQKPAVGNETAEEAYKEAVFTVIDQALRENNIALEEEIVYGISDYIANPGKNSQGLDINFDSDGNGQLSDKEFNNIMLQYYDSYLKSTGAAPQP